MANNVAKAVKKAPAGAPRAGRPETNEKVPTPAMDAATNRKPGAVAPTIVTVTLDYHGETKNTHRWDNPDPDAAISQLYIRKLAFQGADVPQTITVTVQAN